MGIKGFYTFVSSKVPESFQWIKLRDCPLIIDGSNIAYQIYLYTDSINLAYGGDYNLYAQAICDFFNRLKKCNITPYVVMDGGHPLEKKKFQTVKQRMIDTINSCQVINPNNQHSSYVFPLMIRSVFTNVLHRLGIKCITADFEADEDIAVLGKELKCYVLSNDSDFFLHDVQLIILNSINMNKIKDTDEEKKNYMICYKFNRKQFCKSTGVSIKLLPLLAVMVGNDCHDVDIMSDFLNSISNRRYLFGSKRHELISYCLRWLTFQDSNDPAAVVRKIVSRMKNLKSKHLSSIKDCLSSYYPKNSTLLSWFKDHNEDCPLFINFPQLSITYAVDFKCDSNITANIDSQMVCTCEDRQTSNLGFDKELPKWFTFCFRFNIAPCLSTELLNQPCIFALPQIEDTTKPSVHLLFENILQSIRIILWKSILQRTKQKSLTDDSNDINDGMKDMLKRRQVILNNVRKFQILPQLIWYLRKGNCLSNKALGKTSLKSYAHLPTLDSIADLSLEERKKLFFKISCINCEFLNKECMPKNLELILIFVYHWRSNTNDVNDNIFYSVIVCLLMFLIACGRHELKAERYTPMKADQYMDQVETILDSEDDMSTISITEIIESLTPEECQLAKFNLGIFNRETKRVRSDYKRSTVHYFSAFQCSVYYLGVLNSILGFPYPHICISNFWSGTFCYSVVKFLRTEESPLKAIQLLLHVNKRMIHLFDRICGVFGDIFVLKKSTKKDVATKEELQVHKEKISMMLKDKIEKQTVLTVDAEFDTVENPTEEDLAVFAENRFGALVLRV